MCLIVNERASTLTILFSSLLLPDQHNSASIRTDDTDFCLTDLGIERATLIHVLEELRGTAKVCTCVVQRA